MSDKRLGKIISLYNDAAMRAAPSTSKWVVDSLAPSIMPIQAVEGSRHQLAALPAEGVFVIGLQLREGVVDMRMAGLVRAHRQDHLHRLSRSARVPVVADCTVRPAAADQHQLPSPTSDNPGC